jgi:hypothetical protein
LELDLVGGEALLDKCLGADGCAEDLLPFTLPWLAMVAGEVG